MFRFLTPILFIATFCVAQVGYSQEQKSQNQLDGPYLLYKGDSILVKVATHISKEKAEVQFSAQPLSNKENLVLDVQFSNAKEKDFQVKLKKTIEVEPSVWKQPKEMFVMSDIEGEFDAFRNLLLANKIIDDKYEWIFGKGHLVICGDLFDRGKDVPAALWLIYKLEEAAKAKGGYVHTILGNHDIMNLANNLKYLDKKYLLSAAAMGHPYVELYNENTELGRWLRSKNLIEKIGENLFLHGGISPEVNNLKLSVQEINSISRPYLGWENLKNTVKDEKVLNIFNSKTGLFWYRGYFDEPPLDEKVLDEILAFQKAKKIVVGHTILDDNIRFHYQGKVLAIDVNQHEGDHQAVFYKDKKWYKLNLTGNKTLLN